MEKHDYLLRRQKSWAHCQISLNCDFYNTKSQELVCVKFLKKQKPYGILIKFSATYLSLIFQTTFKTSSCKLGVILK